MLLICFHEYIYIYVYICVVYILYIFFPLLSDHLLSDLAISLRCYFDITISFDYAGERVWRARVFDSLQELFMAAHLWFSVG